MILTFDKRNSSVKNKYYALKTFIIRPRYMVR